jgi:peptide/nickel transport system permease protein
MYEALLFRDYVVIQGVLLLIATVVLAINLLIDLSYTKIDPRVSYAH